MTFRRGGLAFEVRVYVFPCRPGGIPARNTRGERLLLYMGVIDILQSYRLKKRLEHAMKAMVHDAVGLLPTPNPPMQPQFPQDTISVHRPGFYATRFQSFYAQSVFRKIPSCELFALQILSYLSLLLKWNLRASSSVVMWSVLFFKTPWAVIFSLSHHLSLTHSSLLVFQVCHIFICMFAFC